jgi:hypothetical protein
LTDWLLRTSSWRPVIQVRGVAAKLFSVRDEMFCQALDTAAGGKLFNVVIDTEEVSSRNVCSVVAVRQFRIKIQKFARSTKIMFRLRIDQYRKCMMGSRPSVYFIFKGGRISVAITRLFFSLYKKVEQTCKSHPNVSQNAQCNAISC